LPELDHVRAGLPAAQHRRQCDDQNLQQIVPRIGRPRVRHPSKNLLELPHPTPSPLWESSSESMLQNNAIEAANPYAIPLPLRGRVRERGGGNGSACGLPLSRKGGGSSPCVRRELHPTAASSAIA